MRRIPLLLAMAFLAGSFVFVSCGQPEKKSRSARTRTAGSSQTKFVKPKPVSQDFVGSEACRQCHAEIMKEYESHPMSISMSVTNEFPVERYPTENPIPAGKGATWSALRQDGKVVHTEVVQSATGEELTRHDESIDYTCGSGTRGCSYFVFDSGRFFQSPLTWYSESQKWDLSPGFQFPHHPRFGRTASDGCMACHAGRMNPVPNSRSAYDGQQPFHELAIGCERCHGPGKDHIAYHENSGSQSGKPDPIVNPEKLEPDLREAVCYQCHLQGEQRVVRYGRSEFDFRPGMHLSDIWITFLKSGDTSGGKTLAVSQVEQMRQSQCFLQSNGKLGCISCHDPHRSPSDAERTGFYRDRCIACHQASQQQTECSLDPVTRKNESADDSCIQCHMPRLGAGDVAHTAQTDHRVHVPGDNYQYELEAQDGFRIWNDQQVPTYEIERAKTIAQSENAFLRKDRVAAEKAMEGLRLFHPAARDDLPLNEALAQLYSAKGDSREALRIWNSLLEQFPEDEFLLNQMALALHENNQFNEAYPLYKRLVEANRRRPQILLRLLDVCTKLNRIEEGKAIALRIIELDPGSRLAHQWLATAYAKEDDQAQAEHHRSLAGQLEEN